MKPEGVNKGEWVVKEKLREGKIMILSSSNPKKPIYKCKKTNSFTRDSIGFSYCLGWSCFRSKSRM